MLSLFKSLQIWGSAVLNQSAAAMSFLLALFVSFAAAVAAQKPCCAPRQFEGLTAMQFSPNSTFREAFSALSYDFTNQVISSNETLVGAREILRQQVLINGTSRTMYALDRYRRECRIIALTQGLDPPCVPSHFRPEGNLYFGALTDRLVFGNFRGRVNDLDVTISATSSNCIPLVERVLGERFHETQSFVNITLGIRDRSVFNVPPECRRAGIPILRRTIKEVRAAFPTLRSILLGFGY